MGTLLQVFLPFPSPKTEKIKTHILVPTGYVQPIEPLSIDSMLELLKDGINLDKLGAAFFKFDAETGAVEPLSEGDLEQFDLGDQVGFTFICFWW